MVEIEFPRILKFSGRRYHRTPSSKNLDTPQIARASSREEARNIQGTTRLLLKKPSTHTNLKRLKKVATTTTLACALKKSTLSFLEKIY